MFLLCKNSGQRGGPSELSPSRARRPTRRGTTRVDAMPRPRKENAERRTEQTSNRWTAAELVQLQQDAVQAGVTVTELIRRRALGERVRAKRGKVDAALVHELNAAGVNLNQWTRHLHRLDPASRGMFYETLAKLRTALDRVLAAYGS